MKIYIEQRYKIINIVMKLI